MTQIAQQKNSFKVYQNISLKLHNRHYQSPPTLQESIDQAIGILWNEMTQYGAWQGYIEASGKGFQISTGWKTRHADKAWALKLYTTSSSRHLTKQPWQLNPLLTFTGFTVASKSASFFWFLNNLSHFFLQRHISKHTSFGLCC